MPPRFPVTPPADTLFVYGTLRPDAGGSSHDRRLRWLDRLGRGRLRGTLYDLGRYPGAVPDHRSAGWIHGWLLRLPDRALRLLGTLDRYEGPDFARRTLDVTHAGGQPVRCYVYVYTGSVAGLPTVAGGNWKARQPSEPPGRPTR